MNVAATYWHLYLSLCPPYNLRKKLQLFTFSLFLGPLYGWGKFVKFEYGCTIAFFDSSANGRWAKNLSTVASFFLSALQNLLAVHIYTHWYNFRSYVISTLIAVLFLPFGDQTCSEKQFQYWDWKIDIKFVWWCIVVVLSPQKCFFSFSGLSLLLRSNRLHSLSLQGTDFLYFAARHGICPKTYAAGFLG